MLKIKNVRKKKDNDIKKLYYWVEGDEGSGQKWFLGDEPRQLIDFLHENDPCVCGVDLMTEKEFENLPEW